jgi:hypothetical protein
MTTPDAGDEGPASTPDAEDEGPTSTPDVGATIDAVRRSFETPTKWRPPFDPPFDKFHDWDDSGFDNQG